MRLLEKRIALGKPGSVKIIPEEPDDLWLAYNLISNGDTVSADTTRKIRLSPDKKTSSSSRVRFQLEIKITAVDYDKNSSVLRLSGKTLVSNEHVKAGAFHTLEVPENKEFVLKKKLWDQEAINKLEDDCKRDSGADLAVVLMQEGTSCIFLVAKSVTTLCAKIEGSSRNPRSKFFQGVFGAFVKHIDLGIVRCVVIGGPGSMKGEFRQYLLSEAQNLKIKSIENNKARIVLAATSSGDQNGLRELLHDTKVLNLIKETKAAFEDKAFREFWDMLSSNSDRICYGSKNVEMAQEMMAIETLLITDDLLQNSDIALRQKYIGLVKSVKEASGKALVLSSMHVSKEQLAKLTGIAAILRFPLPDLDDMEP